MLKEFESIDFARQERVYTYGVQIFRLFGEDIKLGDKYFCTPNLDSNGKHILADEHHPQNSIIFKTEFEAFNALSQAIKEKRIAFELPQRYYQNPAIGVFCFNKNAKWEFLAITSSALATIPDEFLSKYIK